MPNPSVEIDDSRLGWRSEGENNKAPVLVLGSSIYYPRTFSDALREQCRFTFVDLRHFAARIGGRRPVSISIETYLNDIEVLRQEIGLECFTLVGHSHHGNLALEYAKRYPRRVERLVLIGSPPANVSDTLEASERCWDDDADTMRKRYLEQNHERLRERMVGLSREQAFVERYVADGPKYWFDAKYDASWLWRDVPINLDALHAFKSFFLEYTFSLADLTVPVFIAAGRHDYAVPHSVWAGVKQNGTSVTLFEKSGHTPQLEEARAFDETFLAWLGQN